MEIARKKKIPVIMDAAEAHMAKYKNIPIAKIADIIVIQLKIQSK